MLNILCRLAGPIRITTVSRSIVGKQLRDMHSKQIVFKEFGDPVKVAELVEIVLPDKPDDEQVRYLGIQVIFLRRDEAIGESLVL